MNEHVSSEIRNKWPQYEFIGKPFKSTTGKTYIRAVHRVWFDGHTHMYCFEDDFFWHDTSAADLAKLPKVT